MEVSIRDNNIFVGTILKSLEIEDLVCGSQRWSQPCFLARSYIGTADENLLFYNTMTRDVESGGLIPTVFTTKRLIDCHVLDFIIVGEMGSCKFSHICQNYDILILIE